MEYIEDEELRDEHLNYGTDKSSLLKEVQAAGFKPIAITVMMCEETFIFRGSAEAEAAAKQFLPEGWWYDLGAWMTSREKYVKDIYNGSEELAPTIHWLNENYRPK